MQNTLFKKYLRLTSIIIVVSFLLLGMVMLVFIKSYWRDEKQELLTKNARNIAAIAASSLVDKGNGIYRVNEDAMRAFMNVFSQNAGADIFVTDTDGKIRITALGSGERPAGDSVAHSMLESALKDEYVSSIQEAGVMYDSPYYMVGVPIIVPTTGGAKLAVGTVFTACSMRSFDNYRAELVRMFLLAAVAAFMIAFCIVWLFSYRLVRPLHDMSLAAHSFGEGNFAVRVPVTSEDEIGQLALAFNNMAASLSSGENVRRNFIANVSHELKTPMTTIAGFIDGILDGTIPPEKQAHYLRIVSEEVKRLSRLVKSMLALSRIDSGDLHLRSVRFDLTNTIFVALLSFETSIEQKNLRVLGLENAESLFVDGDPDMIHQVVYNLIENAVKFTNPDGYIEVSITGHPVRTNVRIKNSGEGIPAEEVSLIFDRFYKTDKSRSQDKNGMGLGLYIVRMIIKQHGGEITVRSVAGEYCEFEFWLPAKPEELPAGDKENPHKETGKLNGGEHHER